MSEDFKNRWEQGYRLGEGCTIKHGFAFKGEYMTTEENDALPIVVNIVNFQYTGGFRFESTKVQRYLGPFPREYELRPGDVLLVMTCQTPKGEILGVPGRIPHGTQRFLHNQRMGLVVLKGSDVLDLGYLYYLFLSADFNQHLFATSTGAKILHTAPSRIENYRFARPPFDIQRRIASALSAYDDLIENNTRRIKILEDMAQLLYREWFVNFRFPGDEKVRLVDSELGAIPEGWKCVQLSDLMDFQGGVQPPKSEWLTEPRDGYVRMIQIRDYETEVHLGFVKDRPTLQKCQETDIMIARYGASVGRICWGLAGAYNVALVRVKPHKAFFREFLRSFLSSDTLQRLLIGMSGRTAQAGFNKTVLDSISLPIPADEKLFERYEYVARPATDLILNLRKRMKLLRTTRDFLLPKLISGEIPVEAVDNTAAELMEEIAQPA